ncbi:glycine zipper 2TM domain-containing protein [Qipengyuania qiaonensis]|uniref:17 kDa surface antigen n=1 Tax=Qipengyuania qiaonensis TaxID=2867240 RepID=A0ABS7J0N2_9SPHN|nr:glycine zipper 2TM domain-containing protein [Qipengyuania qiaonensis]MBX7480911.1 glycine zipper 2TM domain-containing protein [Qipengyuania qiaonensis]
MKTLALGFAAGSLAIMAAPAAAVELPATNVQTFAVADVTADYGDRKDRRWRHGRGHDRYYDRDGRYYEPRRISRRDRMWRGNDGRYYCRRDNGTTGLVIGAGVGALAGHEIAGRGDRTLGAILGGTVGALVGREIDRGSLKCR